MRIIKFVAIAIGLMFLIGMCSSVTNTADEGTESTTTTAVAEPAESDSAEPEPAPEEEPEPAPEPAPEPEPDPLTAEDASEQAFLEVVRDEIPTLAILPDKDLIGTGHDICGVAAQIRTPFDVLAFSKGFAQGTGGLVTRNEASFLLGASAAAFCPEVANRLTAMTNNV